MTRLLALARSARPGRLAFLLAVALVASGSAPLAEPAPASGDCPGAAALYGKIQVVESFADCKVKVVTSFADLHVELVDSFADEPGEWTMVESFPDHTVTFVESFPDVEIKYVESFPGVQ